MVEQSVAPVEASALAKIDYGSGPAILLFCDDEPRREIIGATVRAAGGRLSAALEIGHAVERIADHAAPSGVIVDLSAAATALAEQILDVIEEGAHSKRFRSIALISADLIDLAAARAGHRDVQLLCNADEADLKSAIARLIAPLSLQLQDISADSHPMKLRELSEEIGRIARTLAALSNRQSEELRLFQQRAGDIRMEPEIAAPFVRTLIRARRLRGQYLAEELFADPAWDMLLDLTAAKLEGAPVAVSSLCIAAAVPATTALRWIKTLTDFGLFVRVADPNDRRRVFIELSPDGFEAMLCYLRAMRRLPGLF